MNNSETKSRVKNGRKGKMRYEKPRVETQRVFEQVALACGKCPTDTKPEKLPGPFYCDELGVLLSS